MAIKVCVDIDCESPTPTGNGETPSPSPVSTHVQTIGNGTDSSFTVTHGLDSDFVLTEVRHVPTGEIRNVSPVVSVLDRNSLSVTFSAPPSADEYAVYVLAVKM